MTQKTENECQPLAHSSSLVRRLLSGPPMSALEELINRVVRQAARDQITSATAPVEQIWVPNPGPQTQAYFCEADELFYGGQAGGGKTDLGIGLALTLHKRSLLLRRINKDALKLANRVEAILGDRDGYNGQLQTWRLPNARIDFGGCEQESDKHRYKGEPHDLIFYDGVS